MQSENLTLHFQLLQRRRLKVAEMHRSRREQIINKARQIFQQQPVQTHSQAISASSQSIQDSQNKQSYGQQSSLSILPNNEEDILFIDKNQLNKSIQEMSHEQIAKYQKISHDFQQQNKSIMKSCKLNKNNNFKKQGSKYAKMIQIPSWLNIVPQQFYNYYGMARPNGKICLLVFLQSWIHIYDKLGRKVSTNKITSENPQKIKKLSQHLNGTIIQVVETSYLQQPIYYITDLIYWKHTVMSAQNFEFRYSWLLANIGQLVNSKIQGLIIKLAQYYLMENKHNLQKIYNGNFGYEKQGLLFVHRQSPYINGFNQNVLIWKDHHISKYPIDQPIKSNISEKNYIYGTGKLHKNGDIYSLDRFKISHINPFFSKNSGGYIRYRIAGLQFKHTQQSHENEMEIQDENIKVNRHQSKLSLTNFQVMQYKRYGRAEPLSRIIFQYRIRYDPLTIEQLASHMKYSK